MWNKNVGEPPVVAHLAGGLGNQLFQMCAALSIARGRPVVLEYGWLKYRALPCGAPDLFGFKFSEENSIVFRRRNPSAFLVGWSYRLLLSSGISRAKDVMHGRFSSRAARVFRNCLRRVSAWFGIWVPNGSGFSECPRPEKVRRIVGYFQTYRYSGFPTLEPLLNSMRPKKRTSWGIETEAKILVDQPIIVHVRLGDYKFEENFGIASSKYYAAGIRFLQDVDPRKPLWVFSDEPSRVLKMLPGSVGDSSVTVVNPPKHASPAEILYIMAQGSAYVIGNSTFGYWAALLSGCESDRIVAPRPWFKNFAEFEHFLPPDWVRLANHFDSHDE